MYRDKNQIQTMKITALAGLHQTICIKFRMQFLKNKSAQTTPDYFSIILTVAVRPETKANGF